MRLVLDASMTLAWCFERAVPAEAQCAEQALSAVSNAEVLVPTLWHTEITNALLVGERRKVVTEARVIDFLNRLSMLPILTDDSAPASHRDSVMALAREHGLTAYDAVYLELALRKDAVLASFDTQLINAMRHAGGEVFSGAIQRG